MIDAYLPNAETLVSIVEALEVDLDAFLLGRAHGKPGDDIGIKDLRLVERVRELEKLGRPYRETAIKMLEAIVVQGSQDAVKARLVGVGR